jgi:hypothetical protein
MDTEAAVESASRSESAARSSSSDSQSLQLSPLVDGAAEPPSELEDMYDGAEEPAGEPAESGASSSSQSARREHQDDTDLDRYSVHVPVCAVCALVCCSSCVIFHVRHEYHTIRQK